MVLPSSDLKTRWNPFVPKKVNTKLQKVLRNRIPTWINLANRNMDGTSVLCPICDPDIKQLDHLFIRYEVMARTQAIFLQLDIDFLKIVSI